MAVALDIAAFAADDEDDCVIIERIRQLARRRRLAVEEPACLEIPRLAPDVDPDLSAVDEVELVLRVVVVVEAVIAGGVDERVDAERRHAERSADLAEAVPLAELVE